MRDIEAVSFDIWGTLLQPNQEFKVQRAQLVATFLDAPFEQVQRAMQEVDATLDAETEHTGIDADFSARIIAVAEAVGKRHRISPDGLAFLQTQINHAFLEKPPTLLEGETTKNTLQALHTHGIPVYLISNTGFINGTTMRIVLDKLGILPFIKGTVFSNETGGVAKPSLAMFRLIERFGSNLSRVLHIGDNRQADYLGARAAGMLSALLKRKKDTLHDKEQEYRSVADVLCDLHLPEHT